ncbi:MAG TPA: hypothetical protein VIJ92_05035 [Ginsengibacter sp.]
MSLYIEFTWIHFCIAFGVMLFFYLIMSFQSNNFFTKHMVVRKFSILDLEFPPSATEMINFIKDIFSLPPAQAKRTLNALRNQLLLDFLFMPAFYGSIFILSMKVSMKMVYFGHKFFAILAWIQLIAWLCDIIENIYLLNKIHPDPTASTGVAFKSYEALEAIKWGIPLLTCVCSVAAICYFWLVGLYDYGSLVYLIIVAIEIIIYFAVKKSTAKSEDKLLQKFLQTGVENNPQPGTSN